MVTPKDESEVIRVAAACARHRIPLTVRGGATGNYGQCVPLEGGVVLDMAAMNAIEWQKPGMIRVQAGARLWDIDAATRPNGWELRMHPSTKRSAQIGGFVAGGSGGAGSVTYGGMREPGNILAARIVTLEETPRVIELRGDAAQKISRAYGTTGIITVLEMPLAPALPWIDVIVAFDDLVQAVKFGNAIALADGIVEKACLADRVAAAAELRRLPALLPGRQEPAARHDRRDVAGKLRDAAGAVRRHGHLPAAGRGRAQQGAALRAHLEPHHAAAAEGRPRPHLPAMPLSARPDRRRGRQGRRDVRRAR